MTIEESTIRNCEDLQSLTSYIMINTISTDETGNRDIIKELLDTKTIASKSDILTIEEQNTKLIKVIQTLLNRVESLERRLNEINTGETNNDLLNELLEKINQNIIE